jgi:hypothetical protein
VDKSASRSGGFLENFCDAPDPVWQLVVYCIDHSFAATALTGCNLQVTLSQMVESLDGTMDSGRRLAFGYGLALATAELAWPDSTLELLSQQPLPMEVVKGNGVTSAV